MLGKTSSRIVFVSFSLFFFGTLFLGHQRLALYENESEDAGVYMYLPKASHIKPFLLGQEAFVADLIWIRTLGYFADELFGPKKFTYLGNLISLATDLDPKFENIYIWAGATMMYNSGTISKEKIMASNRILEKGWMYISNSEEEWRHDPRYWMIPQMIGFNYAVELRDREKAAPFIEAAAKIPGVPDLWKTWAASLYSKAGELKKSTQFLEDMLAVETLQGQLEGAEEEGVKAVIRERLQGYYHRLYGSAEAQKRYLETSQRVESYRREWKDRLPFVRFQLFFVLSPPEGEAMLRTEDLNLYSQVFPLLGMN